MNYYNNYYQDYNKGYTQNQMAVSSTEEVLAIVLTVLLYILFIVIAIAVNYLVARIISSVAVTKGYTMKETHAFAKCFWLGIAGWIYVLALPDRNILKLNKKILEELTRVEMTTRK